MSKEVNHRFRRLTQIFRLLGEIFDKIRGYTMRPALSAAVATLFALILFSGQVYAQRPVSEVTDNEVNEVAKDMFCPTCENVPLDLCPTQACSDWRAIIRQQLADGESKEEIIDYFAERYGEQVRSAPPRYGVFWYFWLMPIVGVGVAAVFFGRYVWNLQKQPKQRPTAKEKPPVGSVAKDDYLARVEKELRKKDE
jgi:cytochrome c-type biogenesis protein CcmH